MDTKKTSREMTLELWRLFFCFVVLAMHLCAKVEKEYFTAAYLGVEYFFVLSGYGVGYYYLKKMADKSFGERLKEVVRYTWSRIQKLYPLYFAALVLMLGFRIVHYKMGVQDVIATLKQGWPELVWLQCTPFGGDVLVVSDWYVAAVFWSGVLILLVLTLTGKHGGLIAMPVVSILVYAYFYKLICKIDVIVSHYATLRAVGAMCIGVFVCLLVTQLERKQFFLQGPVTYVLYAVANMGLFGIFILTNFGHRGWTDFLIELVYGVCFFLLVFVKIPLPERVKNLFGKMGRVTYPIYLFHMPVIDIVMALLGKI